MSSDMKAVTPRPPKKQGGFFRGLTGYMMAKPLVGAVSAGVLAVLLLTLFLGAAHSAGESFRTARDEAAAAVEEKFYRAGWNRGEEQFHVENHVDIHLTELREEARLEVLEVSDVEYVVESRDHNEQQLEAWLAVPGTGVFTVDLRAAEFVVDDTRGSVLIRAPRPELTEYTVDYDRVEVLHFVNGGWRNDSISDGAQLADAQIKAGYEMGLRECRSNPLFASGAKEAARSVITGLVRKLNPERPELRVELEFMQ